MCVLNLCDLINFYYTFFFIKKYAHQLGQAKAAYILLRPTTTKRRAHAHGRSEMQAPELRKL